MTTKKPAKHINHTRQFSPTSAYHTLNKQFFGGRLPPYRVVFANLWGAKRGECLPERCLIRLNRGLALDLQFLRRILLHEMCHIGSLGHGKRFQKKLLRLAEQGEAWAHEEAEQYRTTSGLGEALRDLRGTLDDMAYLEPRPEFPALLRWLSKDWGRKPKELLKMAPWLKAAWERRCREADERTLLRKRFEDQQPSRKGVK